MKTAPFQTIAALQQLAKEGAHPGKGAIAQASLIKILRKYRLTDNDLIEETRLLQFIPVPDQYPFTQLALLIINYIAPQANLDETPIHKNDKVFKRNGKIYYRGRFTKIEFAEVKEAICYYSNEYKRQSDQFFRNYVLKQNLIKEENAIPQLPSLDETDELEGITTKISVVKEPMRKLKAVKRKTIPKKKGAKRPDACSTREMPQTLDQDNPIN